MMVNNCPDKMMGLRSALTNFILDNMKTKAVANQSKIQLEGYSISMFLNKNL